MTLLEILEKTKDNLIISDAFTKADSVLNHKDYKNIACSVSGGADSYEYTRQYRVFRKEMGNKE